MSPCTLCACLLAVRALNGLGLAGGCQLSKSLLRQALPTRTCPTTPPRSRAIRGNQGSPRIRHLPGDRARLGHGPLGGPGSAGPMAGQGRAVGTWPCCGLADIGSWSIAQVRDPGEKQCMCMIKGKFMVTV